MINLGVLYGSRAPEHEVSIISALQLMKSCDKNKYNVVPVYINKEGDWYTGDGLFDINTYSDFESNKTKLSKVELDLHPGSGALVQFKQSKNIFRGSEKIVVASLDCVIPVFHGSHGEDGTIQGLLELANIPYASSRVAACAIGMDKVIMKTFFRGFNIPLADDLSFTVEEWNKEKNSFIRNIEDKLGYPVFVKPANLGSSIGVKKVNDLEELTRALDLAFILDRKVLIEKAVKNPIELNCSVLGDSRDAKASEIEMPITGGDLLGFTEKYLGGANSRKGLASLKRILPAPIDNELKSEIQKLSLKIFKKLDCKGVVRIDYMFEPETEKLYLTEINTIPGSLSYYLWEKSGISYSELIDKLVDIANYAHLQKLNLNFSYESNILKNNSFTKLGSKGIK
ncbi:MAG: D-alanine--D-alanine ligase family protein [Eubacteriales bacterium]|nr:D-alanine--D-alanine ligase family protein [Eubacteriales bacterium]